jgi:5-methylcytosine-specific restriction endonuclease McrA
VRRYGLPEHALPFVLLAGLVFAAPWIALRVLMDVTIGRWLPRPITALERITVPSMPAKLCADCQKRAVNGTRYCDDHQTNNRQAELKQALDDRRKDDEVRKLYRTHHWSAVRRTVLRRDILCRMCGHRTATEADHIIRARLLIQQFGIQEFFNPNRLQGLCHDCHASKTAKEVGFAGAHLEMNA